MRLIAAIFLFLSLPVYAQTQMEMDDKACGDYHNSEQKLADTYNKILKEYAADKVFIKNVEVSQQAWLAYRDAQIKAIYPHEEERGYYGSIYPVCKCNELAYLTDSRTKELERWVQGTAEGDVCAGSIKRNNMHQ